MEGTQLIDNYSETIKQIIVHSQDYGFIEDFICCDELVADWKKHKAKFIEAFHGETRICARKKIKVTLSDKEKQDKFKEFLNGMKSNCAIDKTFEDFLSRNETGFFNNTVVEPFPERNISKGTKLLKSFKKFIAEPEILRYVQDVASRFIQDDKIEGYLWLSVDPIDFLTISENNANWRSCHAIDGDYRMGNLSYMVDDTTIIAYIADEKEAPLTCLPEGMTWNSKKWRMLIHLNDFVAYFNKHYPFYSSYLRDETLELLNFTMGREFSFLYPDLTFNYKGGLYMMYGDRIFNLRDIIDTKDYCGYCDLTEGTCPPMVAVEAWPVPSNYYDITNLTDAYDFVKEHFGIKIGNPVKCLIKGCSCNVTRQDKFLCDSCLGYYDLDEDVFLRCTECGRHIYQGETFYYYADGAYPVCAQCWKTIQKEDKLTEEDTYGS